MKSSQEESKTITEQRVNSAVDAMNAIGISPQLTKLVLKRLLKAYDYKWEYIEEENYRLLADSIFESDFSKGEKSKRKTGDVRDYNSDSKDDLDNGASNRKRTGKEVGPMSSAVANVREESPNDVQIVLSARGEVNLSLNCSSAIVDSKDFQMPSVEGVCKLVEDRWLGSAKKLEPNLSFMNLLQKMRECVLELGYQSVGVVNQHFGKKDHKIVPKQQGDVCVNQRGGDDNGNGRSAKKMKPTVSELPSANSNNSLAVQQPQAVLEDVKRVVNPRDITNGQERYRIALVIGDNVSYDLPSFHYVRHNVVYQNASVPISLARIGDENCCTDCYGDCLKASIPCACARETGGEYAYTSEGLLTDSFLDSYISKYRHTQDHHLHFCQICPLERIKNEANPARCRGHLIGTFIKECWTKCGCSLQCGNRVVQRGIRCHLEVFYSGKKKGWGVRSRDELPRGSFVCEYAGEILTNMELYERTMCATGNEKHTYPVMLDADWASEGILNDEEALCLDATKYGNVARFMNHRCCDGNVVEIPIEIETPDHHYYHVAFFTTRKVEPLEELCWDYGINFDDHNHPIKAFKCCCGSELCRDKSRSRKSNRLH